MIFIPAVLVKLEYSIPISCEVFELILNKKRLHQLLQARFLPSKNRNEDRS
jgi:hypothetical protein